MTLTVSLAGDLLIDALSAYRISRKLTKLGWAYPPDSSIRHRFRRGVKPRRLSDGIFVFATVILISVLELTLEFSSGAELIWTEKSVTLRMARKAANLSVVLQGGPNYISRIREALQRVENTCFNIKEAWYYPVSLNLSSSNEFNGLGQAVICPKNYSEPTSANEDLMRHSFAASEILTTKLWNASQLRCGRDVGSTEVTVPLTEAKDEDIGAPHKFSFVAVNFRRQAPDKGSETPLTAKSDYIAKPTAFYTARFTLESNNTLECLLKMKWVKSEPEDDGVREIVGIEVCLVPVAENRSVLALYDDIENGEGHQLVMSVALDGVRSFHDMKVLPALPLMVGQNNGEHTYRELATMTIMSSQMFQRINTDGFHDEQHIVADESKIAPTLNEWGLGLYVAGLVVIVFARSLIRRKDLQGKGNLGTAKGVAEHWMLMIEDIDDNRNRTGRVVFVSKPDDEAKSNRVSVERETELRNSHQDFGDIIV
ncbi:hypothetical protein FGB62_73g12 [Gracilaria domingensis]|nr:hypothetical protein FGB62_73g12 [Gracilaria domingensis]